MDLDGENEEIAILRRHYQEIEAAVARGSFQNNISVAGSAANGLDVSADTEFGRIVRQLQEAYVQATRAAAAAAPERNVNHMDAVVNPRPALFLPVPRAVPMDQPQQPEASNNNNDNNDDAEGNGNSNGGQEGGEGGDGSQHPSANERQPNEGSVRAVQNDHDDDDSSSSGSSSSSSSSSESESESDDNESTSSDDGSTSDEDTDDSPQGEREEQEAYRKLSVDKEVFHLLHKIRSNDPTATGLSLLPEADRVLLSCDWDTSTLLTHKKSHRPLTRRELLSHVARQMQSQQAEQLSPTGAQLLQEALARPPLFLKELQLYVPLIAHRLNAEIQSVLATFLATSTCLRQLTLFHTSTGWRQPNNNHGGQQDLQIIPTLMAAVAQSRSVKKLALRKLSLPAETDCSVLLRNSISLTDLELSYCSLQSTTSNSLKNGLSENSTLTKLTLFKDLNDLEPSFAPVFEGLMNHKSLNELAVEIMSCHQQEMITLGECVTSISALESLSLVVASNQPRRSQGSGQNTNSTESGPPNELNASPFFLSIASSDGLKNLRLHPYVTLTDPENAWRKVLDTSVIESFDLAGARNSNSAMVESVVSHLTQAEGTLHIRDMNLSNASCHGQLQLKELFTANPSQCLAKLHLRNCHLMDSDIEELAAGFQQSSNASVKEIDLGSNYIGYHGLHCLATALCRSEELESLDLSFNSFGHFSCVRSFSLLLKSTSIKNLDVSCTDMFAQRPPSNSEEELLEVADELRACLADNSALTCLAADDDGFSDALSIAFFIGLRDNCHLRELSIDGNSIRLASRECRQSLVEMLAKNQTLTRLNLPRNRGMTEQGFRALSSGVKRSKSLKVLSVRVLNAETLPKLLTAITTAGNLVELNVTMPSAPDRAQVEGRILQLLQSLGKVKTFQRLTISNSGAQHLIAPSTGNILLEILRQNPSFHTFNLSLALCPFELRVMIEFFVELNRRGRRFLDSSLQQPVGLWPHILAPLTNPEDGCSMYLFFFLREHIALHQRSN